MVRLGFLLSAALLIMSACGSRPSPTDVAGGSAPASSPVQKPTQLARPTAISTLPSTQSSVSAATATSASGAQSPLKRRDPVPAGVAAQLAFGAGGGAGSCASAHPADRSAQIVFPVNPIELAGEAPNPILFQGIALNGFTPNQFIAVDVRRPDGTVVRKRAVADCTGSSRLTWVALPGDPLGEYKVTAGQGSIQMSNTFTVQAALTPRIAAWPISGPAGASFTLGLAGFAPEEKVAIHLYSEGKYISTLPDVKTNERGEARYVLTTKPDDPIGHYQFALFAPGTPNKDLDRTQIGVGAASSFPLEAVAIASSTLAPEEVPGTGIVTFEAYNSQDIDSATSWVEGVAGPGIDEVIALEFEAAYTLTGIEIENGYARNPELFVANNRVRRARLVYEDGTSRTIELDDTRKTQSFVLDNVISSRLTFVIEDVYPGSQYDDTAITRLHAYGYESR